MGSGQTKDNYIDIYIETSKPCYYGGDFVGGCVYINCKGNRPYTNLFVRLQGDQYVHWSEGSGKNRRSYSNRRKTYTDQFLLAKFANGTIPGGHYKFPFSFLLPKGITGSFFDSESCYIRYPLQAYLTSTDGKNDNQAFIMNLNILQPLRFAPFGIIQNQNNIAPQCCGCCKQYGVIKTGLTCDKNFVKADDQISVQGFIDNSVGKAQISQIQVSFLEHRIMVSSGGRTRSSILFNQMMYALPKIVNPGQGENFSFNATIPSGIVDSTAIGAVTAKWFTLTLSSQMGCCTTTPSSNLHIIYSSSTPKVQTKPVIQPPVGWNPNSAALVVYNNFKPFLYAPVAQIPYHNQQGNFNAANNLQAMNLMNPVEMNNNINMNPYMESNQNNYTNQNTYDNYNKNFY